MEFEGICLNCFAARGEYDVCPYCGFVAGSLPPEGYLLRPGTRLWGRYVIGTVLGSGGFGITYRAWDTRLNALVAIKEFFSQSLVSRIPGETKVRVFSGDKQQSYIDQLARFMDEAKNLAKFTGDPRIVSVLDYFEDNNTAYIVMEYLDGLTLKEYMAQKGGRLPAAEALAIEKALLEALSSIHKQGVIHRDVSPDNIFILNGGGMKLLDFGAARFAARENPELTRNIVVKKGYAPPEQYRSNMKQGVWTDIYAAGATLYKMVTGITPEESIERTEKDQLPRPSRTGTVLDASIDKAVMKAMALRPELRFKSAEDMLAALENKTSIDFPEVELKKRRRASGLIAAACVALVAVLGVFVGWQTVNNPGAVSGGPSLADMEADADTITFFSVGDEDTEAYMQNLADAFMAQYPQHTVNVEVVPYGDTVYDDITPRFLTAEAPTVFPSGTPNLDNSETPYLIDLAPLYRSLDLGDYYLMQESYDKFLDEDTGEIHRIMVGLQCPIAYIDLLGAQERGYEIPTHISSYEELMEMEDAAPGSILLESYDFGRTLGVLHPEIRDNENFPVLEEYLTEYVTLYKQGYFQEYVNERENKYSTELMDFDTSYTSNMRWRQENIRTGQFQIIPVTPDGVVRAGSSSTYGVSSYATENQQRVGMLFLHFLLSESGQHIYHVQNDNSLPVHRDVMRQFIDANPEYAFLTTDALNRMKYGYSSLYIPNFYELLRREASLEEIVAVAKEEYEDWL